MPTVVRNLDWKLKCLWLVNFTDLASWACSCVIFREKFQVVFAITVRDIFISVVYCAIAIYSAFAIPVGFSHEIWPYPGNTATPSTRFLWPIDDRFNGVPL